MIGVSHSHTICGDNNDNQCLVMQEGDKSKFHIKLNRTYMEVNTITHKQCIVGSSYNSPKFIWTRHEGI